MNYIRHCDRSKTYRPLLTEFKEDATWIDQLKVMEGEKELIE